LQVNKSRTKLLLTILQNSSIILFVLVFLYFGLQSKQFLEPGNLVNILIQSSSVGIVAIGMTFVLLTAGIDLSVGSIMFIAAVIAGKMALGGYPLWLSIAVILLIGLLCGAINSFFITRLKIMAFIVTLATFYAGRGIGLRISQTRAMNLPESFLVIGSSKVLGIPTPIIIFTIVLVIAHLVLTRTTFGRQIYAVGNDIEAAKKAGINSTKVLTLVYIISGFCAALGGLVSLVQLGAVSPTFGYNREFLAVAAAVLGGTSLFGGRGNVFPGTVLGAILIQTVENGLVLINADPYVYPLITAFIIFLAVFIDSLRFEQMKKLGRRKIRVESTA
jgi:ribose transport system permease protein